MIDVLHLLDRTTTAEGFEQLALLLKAASHQAGDVRHRLAVLGPHDTVELARQAGLADIFDGMLTIRSAGWADPTGWRALRRALFTWDARPTLVHAWGMSAIVAATVAFGKKLPCVGLFTEPPDRRQTRLLRVLDRPAWRWVAMSSATAQALAAAVAPDRISLIPPAVSMADAKAPEEGIAALRLALGIAPDEGPILLLAGDGPSARHDWGLWSGAILQQIYPRTRVLVRENPRFREDAGGNSLSDRRATDPGLDRFRDALPDPDLLVVAPGSARWSALVHAADVLLATPDHSTGTGALLAAMAAGTPVIATPVPAMTELVSHGDTGLVARHSAPRFIAARLEEYMNDSTLRPPFVDRARARVYAQNAVSAMAERFLQLWKDLGGTK
ncbi:MAG TPA: glycosyltransferase [Phycisphaerae bacterium]|nr:glycosyltransferase [Phycisphaerae bacterium]